MARNRPVWIGPHLVFTCIGSFLRVEFDFDEVWDVKLDVSRWQGSFNMCNQCSRAHKTCLNGRLTVRIDQFGQLDRGVVGPRICSQPLKCQLQPCLFFQEQISSYYEQVRPYYLNQKKSDRHSYEKLKLLYKATQVIMSTCVHDYPRRTAYKLLIKSIQFTSS